MKKMVQTSNFAKSGKDPLAIAISRTSPYWYRGRIYPMLYPPEDLLKGYQNGRISEEEYTHRYNLEVLAKQDPYDVIDMIGENAILICWENSGKFCHRHLVAKWLEEALGLTISEIGISKLRKPRVLSQRVISAGQTTLLS